MVNRHYFPKLIHNLTPYARRRPRNKSVRRGAFPVTTSTNGGEHGEGPAASIVRINGLVRGFRHAARFYRRLLSLRVAVLCSRENKKKKRYNKNYFFDLTFVFESSFCPNTFSQNDDQNG